MSCEVVFTYPQDKKLDGRKFASHAALARVLKPGKQCTVQETSGTWEGWYRVVGVDENGKQYWTSRPQMEY